MNIAKIVFFLIASCAVSLGLNFSNKLNPAITGLIFADSSSIYFETKSLISVSKQIYNLNGFIVNEIVLDLSNSPSQIKIYSIQAPSPSQIGNQVSDTLQANTNYNIAKSTLEKAKRNFQNIKSDKIAENIKLPNTVSKLFPASTHSRTLEFNVPSKDELEHFYQKIVSIFSEKGSSQTLKGALFKFEKE